MGDIYLDLLNLNTSIEFKYQQTISKTYTSSVNKFILSEIEEDFKIQFDDITILALISLSSFLVVIILIKGIYRHNPHGHEQYGDEIVLFHSADSYKKRVFRFHLIEDLKNSNIKGNPPVELELKVVMGEFSQESQEIIKHAINHRFKHLTIITGPKVFCEDRTEIYTLLDKYENFNYLILPERPNKHFMIFHNSHLYIEKPHKHNKSRGSVGIKKCNLELIKTYDKAFNKMLKYAKPIKKEEILNQECYNN